MSRNPPSPSIIRSEFESLLSETSDDEEESTTSNTINPTKQQSRENLSKQSVPRLHSDETEDEDEIILSVIWSNNRLGAAYYNICTSELHVLEDILDDVVQFMLTKTFYRQCQPRYVVTISDSSSAFTNVLKKLIIESSSNDESDSSSSIRKSCSAALKIVSKKEHSFEHCCHRVRCLQLSFEPANASNAERFIFLNTILNFRCHAMIHALGSLLIFLDKHWSNLALDPTGKPSFLALNHVMLNDLVMVDEDTYRALNIVMSRHHPSFFKFDNARASTQGVSLFSLLNRCRSRPGMQFLWKTLQHPTRDIAVLEKRLNAIEFFLDPNNHTLVENLLSCLRHVRRPTNTILNCDSGPQAKASDWYKLHKTTTNVIYIADILESHVRTIDLFKRIADSITNEMRNVKYFIEYVLDFDASRRENKFVVKPNVDPLLDELNHARSTLPQLLTRMGEKDMREHLPASVSGCKMVYLPNIGYVLGINEWNPTPPEGVEYPSLEFKFTINGVHYYKSPSARELDETMGDLTLKIAKRESRILQKLVGYISKQAGSILHTIQLCAELDTLLAFYAVARDYNYVRPKIVQSQILDIKEGRHPLQECLTTFVPNDICSGNGKSLLKILTGPNSCGKSIYLKQIGLIVFMAHIGCYLPAKSATIGVVTHILTQMLNTDSVNINASSFFQDLRQINAALYASTPNSLVIMDEFGRGTSEVSGISLLAAVLNSFVDRGVYCPHVFAATHIHRVLPLLPQTSLIEAQTFEYVANGDNGTNDSLTFLYRLTRGNTTCSFAHSMARSANLEGSIVNRALEVFEKLKEGALPPPLPDTERKITVTDLVEYLTKSDEDLDLEELKNVLRHGISLKKM